MSVSVLVQNGNTGDWRGRDQSGSRRDGSQTAGKAGRTVVKGEGGWGAVSIRSYKMNSQTSNGFFWENDMTIHV